jgi:two-component system CheB/CheR fusion protein
MAEPNFIVGLGGSAGSLEPYRKFLQAISPDTGIAFVFIAHMSPTAKSELGPILSKSTTMPVAMASQGMKVEANHVYVITPNTDLTLEGEAFDVASPRTMKAGRHPQVDLFLTSLAMAFGKRAIGIIFSGGDGDGTEGCKQIKERGGLTFAQDFPLVESMPRHAFDAGCVDFVLPPEEIAEKLTGLTTCVN